MGTIIKRGGMTCKYAVYFSETDDVVAIESLANVQDRLIEEIPIVDAQSSGGPALLVCPPGKHPVNLGGRICCIP